MDDKVGRETMKVAASIIMTLWVLVGGVIMTSAIVSLAGSWWPVIGAVAGALAILLISHVVAKKRIQGK